MRRLIVYATLCALLLPGVACKRRPKRAAAAAEEEPAGLATMLHAADPRSTVQLIRGFHDVEQGAWRWTQKNFAVTLRPPTGAAAVGANLVLKLAVPDVVVQKVGAVTLSARIGSLDLAPETYRAGGEVTYQREVPASALKGDAVTIEFALDKALAPSNQDTRELGVIVSMVGFEAKQ
jgi:hypothetical protein